MKELFIKSNIVKVLSKQHINCTVIKAKDNLIYYITQWRDPTKTSQYHMSIEVNITNNNITTFDTTETKNQKVDDILQYVPNMLKNLFIIVSGIRIAVKDFYAYSNNRGNFDNKLTRANISRINQNYNRINDVPRDCNLYVEDGDKLLHIGYLTKVMIRLPAPALEPRNYVPITHDVNDSIDIVYVEWKECIIDTKLNNFITYKDLNRLNIFNVNTLFLATLLKNYPSDLKHCDPCTGGFTNAVQITAEDLGEQEALFKYNNLGWEDSDDYNFYLLMNLIEYERNLKNETT